MCASKLTNAQGFCAHSVVPKAFVHTVSETGAPCTKCPTLYNKVAQQAARSKKQEARQIVTAHKKARKTVTANKTKTLGIVVLPTLAKACAGARNETQKQETRSKTLIIFEAKTKQCL